MKTQKWQGWGQIPAPKFGLGDGVMSVVDEPHPDWPKSGKPWRYHWCLGMIVGVCQGKTECPISEAIGFGWMYQVLILKEDGDGFFNIWDEPDVILMHERELGRSTRARSLVTTGAGQGAGKDEGRRESCSCSRSLMPAMETWYTTINTLR